MKNILQIILISFFTFNIISCAKKSDSSSSSTVTTMSTPTIADGNYKVTAYTQGQYYSDGSHYTTYTYTISHDSSVTPGYLGYIMAWQGSGVYRITLVGKGTFSSSGLSSETLDCTTNDIRDFTLDSDGLMINKTILQTGCGGGTNPFTLVSSKYSAISGGMTKYIIFKDSSSNQYRFTITLLKQ